MDIDIIMTFKDGFINIKHFSPEEILMGKEVPEHLLLHIHPTVWVLDQLRAWYGKPIYVNSTYRSSEHNRGIGGKTKSLHLDFNAVDFTVERKRDINTLYKELAKWDSMPGRFEFLPKDRGNMGLGLYPRFIHIDTRSILGRYSPTRWSGV